MTSPDGLEGEPATPSSRLAIGWFGGRGRLLALGIAVLFVLWLARGIIGPFVFAAVLAYAFSPVVSAIEERTRAPRAMIIGVGYVLVLGAIALVAVVAAERAGAEIRYLSSGGPDVIATAMRKIFGDQVVIAGMTYNVSDIAAQIRGSLFGMIQTPSNAIYMAEQAVDIALQAILALIVTFYFLLDGRRFGLFALHFLDRSQRAEALRIGRRVHVVLGRWLRGQLLLIALVATVLYVVLGPILHVPYALALAIVSGVLEIIPLVGPIIAAALAGTVAFATRGTDTTIVVLVIYLVLRQVEDQVVMPLVIGRAVHLHPVVTIFAVLVGLSAWGILGGLLGVPVAAALNVTLHELYPEQTGPGTDGPERGGRIRERIGGRLRRGGRPAGGGSATGLPEPQDPEPESQA
jgi:predicted PurR-regulated permease PerM